MHGVKAVVDRAGLNREDITLDYVHGHDTAQFHGHILDFSSACMSWSTVSLLPRR